MAKSRTTLKQRIALDGGKEIEAEFKTLGKVGEQAFAMIADAAKAFSGPGKRLSDLVKRLKSAMGRLRAVAKRVGDSWRRLGRSARKLGSSLRRMGRNLALVGVAGLAAAAALFKLAQSGAAAGDAAAKTAQGLGLTVTELGRLSFAAEQSGLTQEKLKDVISRLNQAIGEGVIEARKAGAETKKLGDFADRAKASFAEFGVVVRNMTAELGGAAKGLSATEETGTLAARALKRLGITVLDAKGNVRSARDVLFDLADAFKAMPDGVEKSAIAIDILGNRLARLAIPMFNLGGAAIRALGDDAENMGIVFTEAEGKISEAAVDAQNQLKVLAVGGGVFKGLLQDIGLIFAPDLKRAADAMTEALIRNRKAIVAFAEGGIQTAIAVVKELVTAFSGREHRAGEDLSEFTVGIIAAVDAVKAFARDVKAAFSQIIIPIFDKLIVVADFVTKAINFIFGTDFETRTLLIAAAVLAITGVFAALVSAIALAGAAIGVVFNIFSAPIAAIIAALAAATIAAIVFWDDIKAGAQGAWDFVTGLWSDLGDVIGGFADAMADRLVSAFRGAVNTIGRLLKRLADAARRAFQAAKSALGFSGGGGAPVPALARGGRVRGPGTATSDSIPVRLSRGEFVIRAAAVERYGAELFATLNALRLPKGALSGFSFGGLVQGLDRALASIMPVPAFAAGGLTPALAAAPAGGRPITLVLDNQRFPMRADQEVAEALGRVALGQARSSAGRPPRRL